MTVMEELVTFSKEEEVQKEDDFVDWKRFQAEEEKSGRGEREGRRSEE